MYHYCFTLSCVDVCRAMSTDNKEPEEETKTTLEKLHSDWSKMNDNLMVLQQVRMTLKV